MLTLLPLLDTVFNTLEVAWLDLGEFQKLKLHQHTCIYKPSTPSKAKLSGEAGGIGCQITHLCCIVEKSGTGVWVPAVPESCICRDHGAGKGDPEASG